jgi:hypothetical protein
MRFTAPLDRARFVSMAAEARSSFRRRFSLASLIAVAFATVALMNAPTADAGQWRSCGDQKGRGAGYFDVYARNVGCKKARSVAHEWFWGGGSETGESRGFTCDDRRIGIESSKVRCLKFLGDGEWQVVKFKAGA